jgi:type II secretory pathway pseudopilin PulG
MALREITNMRRRSAFTLVEVLVSMALILFIMSILAAAFGAASQAVSDLKAAGDLAEKLRGATGVLKRDLESDHFRDSSAASPRLSDPNFLSNWLTAPNVPTGFFRIYQGQADTFEGNDLDQIPSFSQVTTSLHYTIALKGTRRSDFLSASVPGGSPLTTPQNPASANDTLLGPPDQRYQDNVTGTEYNQQYAEVAVFLAPVADQTDPGPNNQPQQLYALYRRQFLTVPPGWATPTAPQQIPASPPNLVAPYLEVSSVPTAGEPTPFPYPPNILTFNRMQDLSSPIRRFWMQRSAPPSPQLFPQGALYPPGYATMGSANAGFSSADLLMTDVLSFDVRVLLAPPAFDFVDLFDPSVQAFSNNNPAFTPPLAPNGPRVFDTWSNQTDALTGVSYTTSTTGGALTSVPLFKIGGVGPAISIQAIQITLRVWDFKTKKTRQVTIVQQM